MFAASFWRLHGYELVGIVIIVIIIVVYIVCYSVTVQFLRLLLLPSLVGCAYNKKEISSFDHSLLPPSAPPSTQYYIDRQEQMRKVTPTYLQYRYKYA